MENYHLYMLLLGANPPGRIVEQHDYYFGIATNIEDLYPKLTNFWPEAGKTLHLDGWRKVENVGDYRINIHLREPSAPAVHQTEKLYFMNLGGYTSEILEEQHLTLLTVAPNRKEAVKKATSTTFFKSKVIPGNRAASPHLDEKLGFDVDDLYQVEEILNPDDKNRFTIRISTNSENRTDPIHLGYTKFL